VSDCAEVGGLALLKKPRIRKFRVSLAYHMLGKNERCWRHVGLISVCAVCFFSLSQVFKGLDPPPDHIHAYFRSILSCALPLLS
jgi:hypothetical protein